MKHNSIRENKADIVVIGSGAAGAVAAYKLAKKGLSVILLEKGKSLNDSDFSKISGFILPIIPLPSGRKYTCSR